MSDTDLQTRITERTEEQAVSLWYTYNQHFTAANFYRYLAISIDIGSVGLGGVLTYSLIWNALSMRTMAGLAVLIAVLTGVRAAVRPERQEERIRQSAHKYHRLFDEMGDFLALTLSLKNPNQSTTFRHSIKSSPSDAGNSMTRCLT